jgi:hypothetical protein
MVEKVQGLKVDSGMTGIEEERLRGDGSPEVRPVRRSSESGGGVPVAGMQEGNGKMARKFLRIDVVLVVSLAASGSGGAMWLGGENTSGVG